MNKLKAKIIEQGKQQKDLTRLLKLKYGAVNKKINGHIKFKPNEIEIMRKWLNLTNDEVVEIFLS